MSKGDGRYIAIEFSKPLIGDVSGLTPNPIGGYKDQNIDLSNATVTSLNQYSSSHPVSNAIDGNTSTYWRGTTIVNWIQFQLETVKVVSKLRMYLGSYYVGSFTISGSNDGGTWTQIGNTRIAATTTTSQWYEFGLENSQAYQYYRVDTLTGYDTSRVYIYEIELCESVPVGNEKFFTVTIPEYDMVPEGTLNDRIIPVIGVSQHPTSENTILLEFGAGNINSIQNAAGPVTVAYSGGNLQGNGGPVEAFSQTFTATDLDYKGNQNDAEHLEIADVSAVGVLMRIYYTDTQSGEHLEIVGITAEGILTHVDDV